MSLISISRPPFFLVAVMSHNSPSWCFQPCFLDSGNVYIAYVEEIQQFRDVSADSVRDSLHQL